MLLRHFFLLFLLIYIFGGTLPTICASAGTYQINLSPKDNALFNEKVTSKKESEKSSSSIRSVSLSGIRYLNLADIAKNENLRIVNTKGGCIIVNKTHRFELLFNKRAFTHNKNVLNWLRAPAQMGNEAYLSEQDYLLIIKPLVDKKSLKKHPIRTICIDAGHGGNDQGCKGRTLKEKVVTLALALKLRTSLLRMGYKVVLTRSSDLFIELSQRPKIANNKKADLFISIHCNSVNSRTVRGIETFCLTPAGSASTYDTKPNNKQYAGNAFNKNNYRLAYDIQDGLVTQLKGIDRGVKHARFAVLRDIQCPAILIEVGFLSHPVEERQLGAIAYQDQIVKSITNAIIKYHKQVR